MTLTFSLCFEFLAACSREICWQKTWAARNVCFVWASQPYTRMQRCPCATHLAFSKKIQVSLFLGRREEGEGVVHTDVSGDSRTEKEQRKFHKTFLFFFKKTNNGENVALSNFDSRLVPMNTPPYFLKRVGIGKNKHFGPNLYGFEHIFCDW